jgi:hypothetical protein
MLWIMDPQEHWDSVYAKKRPHEVSSYRPHLERSLWGRRDRVLPPGASMRQLRLEAVGA